MVVRVIGQSTPLNVFRATTLEVQMAVTPMLLCLVIVGVAGVRRLLLKEYRISRRLDQILRGVAILTTPLLVIYIIFTTINGMLVSQTRSLLVALPNAIVCVYVVSLGMLLWAASRLLSRGASIV